MYYSIKVFVLTIAATVMMGIPCLSQDVEPPFTWEGEGAVTFIRQEGTEVIDFDIKLSIDKDGYVKGYTKQNDSSSTIKHVFASEKKEYELPGFFSRKVVIVLMLNENDDNPMLAIMNGRLLVDKFFYGETLLTRYEAGSDIAKALGIGNPQVTLMEEGGLPWNLQSMLDKCLPFGVVQIEGKYKKDAEPISLFNGENLEGWHIFLKDADVDPKEVWKVKDGAIWCKGDPLGFLRTKEEYSDFKLSVEWRWPENPTNSGILLRMSDEETTFPLCMEAQLKHQSAGDVVGMGCDFNENQAKEDSFFRHCPRQNESSEVEPGGWNTYEIICKGDTIELTVNGQFQNKATGVGVRKGHIGLQSEGSPIMFRNIKLIPLD